jgi:hypothetical protein
MAYLRAAESLRRVSQRIGNRLELTLSEKAHHAKSFREPHRSAAPPRLDSLSFFAPGKGPRRPFASALQTFPCANFAPLFLTRLNGTSRPAKS